MQILHRPEAPRCLASKNHETQRFESLSATQKKAIWRELTVMQGVFCAYCEKIISKRNRQIEHFFPKNDSPDGINSYAHLTFEWSNLFGGCIESEHCGQHKDRDGPLTPKPYSPVHLIKPDVNNPNTTLLYTELGNILVRDSLEKDQTLKGEETIRVFNLNSPSLVDSRRDVISAFNIRLKAILELGGVITKDDFDCQIDQLNVDIEKSEHRTAIKTVLYS